MAVGLTAPRNELTCSICVDVLTDLDNFITSDTTEQDIVDFAKNLCKVLGFLLGETLEEQCNAMFEDNLPGIIDGLVDGMPPRAVCEMIFMCP